MKALRMILLFVVCTAMAACGGENLDVYKDKVLEEMARTNDTTKELFVKDYDVIVDSLSLYSITVADSIDIIKDFDAYEKRLHARISELEKSSKNLFNFNLSSDKRELEKLKNELPRIEVGKLKLSEYEGMREGKVLIKVLRFWAAIKIPILGRRTSIGYAIFSEDGNYITDADFNMKEYVTKNKMK